MTIKDRHIYTLLGLLLENTSHTFCIAGGCLRDLDNNRPIKDIDVFVNVETYQEFLDYCKELKLILGSDVYYNDRNDYEENEEWPARPNIVGVATFYTCELGLGGEELTDVQIIGYSSGFKGQASYMFEVLGHFDFKICQIALCNDTGEIYRSPNYRQDIIEKKISFIGGLGFSVDHASRLLEKYPDFEMAGVPEEFLGYLIKQNNLVAI